MRYASLVLILLFLAVGCSNQDSVSGDSIGKAAEAPGGEFVLEENPGSSAESGGIGFSGDVISYSHEEDSGKLELLEPGSIEAVPQPEIPQASYNPTINIHSSKFSADDLSIGVGTTVTWVVADGRRHIVSCYKDGRRQFQSRELYAEGKFSHEFSGEGTFTCVDSIYGLRGKVRVSGEMGMGMAAPTGYVINIPQGASEPSYFVMLLLLAGIFSSVFFYGKKRKNKKKR